MTDPILGAQPNEGGAYRYFFQFPHEADDVGVFAGELLGVYGVSMTKYLNKPGDMTFSIRLDSWINSPNEFTPPADLILPITEPYRSSIWVYRNDKLVWGGIVTSRTWQSQGRVMNFTARTHDALFRRLHYNHTATIATSRWPANLIYEIVRRGINQGPVGENLQAEIWIPTANKPGYPKEIDISAAVGLAGPTYNMSTDIKKAPPMSELIDNALKLGAEYRLVPFDTAPGASGNERRVRWEIGQTDAFDEDHQIGKSSLETTEVYQYPGSIFRYWWPESMGETTGAGEAFILRGQDDGAGTYPQRDFYVVNTKSRLKNSLRFQFQTTSQTELNNIADTLWQDRIPPAVNPTFELDISHPDVSPYPEDLDVGDYVRFLVSDPIRFGTEVIDLTKRVIGWSLSPPTESSVEQLGIQIEQMGDET